MTEVMHSSLEHAALANGGMSVADAARRRVFVTGMLVLLTFAALWPSTQSLMQRWQDTEHRTYTHGFAVVAIVLWLLWRDRARWVAVAGGAFAPGLVLSAVLAFAWLVAYRAGLQIVHQALLPMFAATAVLTVFGPAVLRRCWFPLAYLYLAIPVWDALLPLLQTVSVMAVRFLLRASDVPAFFAGNTFQIPTGVFEIADGCSGLHFFVVALTVSLLYGEINRDGFRVRAKLVALACLLAMLTNWLRIYIIVLAGYLTDMQHRLVTDEHYSFGWYMFAGMMLLYMLIVRRWPAGPVPVAPPAPPPVAVPVNGAVLALLGLALVPAWNLLDENRASPESLEAFLPKGVAPVAMTDTRADWQPKFRGADREVFAAAAGVTSYTALYAEQRQGKEVVYFENSILGPGLRRTGASVAAPGGRWTEQRASSADGRISLLWYAYRLEDRWYHGALRLQLAYGLESLAGKPVVALIALRADCSMDDCTAARAALANYSETHYQ